MSVQKYDTRKCQVYVGNERDRRNLSYLQEMNALIPWFDLMFQWEFSAEKIFEISEILRPRKYENVIYDENIGTTFIKDPSSILYTTQINCKQPYWAGGNKSQCEIHKKIIDWALLNRKPDYWSVDYCTKTERYWVVPWYIFPEKVCIDPSLDEPPRLNLPSSSIPKRIVSPEKISIARPVTGPNGMIIGNYDSNTKVFQPLISPQVLSMKDVQKVVKDMQWLRKASVQELNKYLDKKIPELRSNKMDVYPPIYKEMTDKFFQKDLKTPEYF